MVSARACILKGFFHYKSKLLYVAMATIGTIQSYIKLNAAFPYSDDASHKLFHRNWQTDI